MEFDKETNWNHIYFRFLSTIHSHAKQYAERTHKKDYEEGGEEDNYKEDDKPNVLHADKQMKTSLTGLLNQLKTENTRAR